MTDEKDDKLEAGDGDWQHLQLPDAEPIEKPTWPEKYTATGRIPRMPEFQHLGTVSGRFSSSKPNIREQPPSSQKDPNTATTPPASALSGSTPSVIIIDSVPDELGASKLALALKDLDLSDIELRVMSQLDVDWDTLQADIRQAGFDFGAAVRQLGQAFKAPTLSAAELGLAMHKHMLDNPELYMSKDERRHSGHPTEKNPNHPRFQNQPTRPGKRSTKQRKQR